MRSLSRLFAVAALACVAAFSVAQPAAAPPPSPAPMGAPAAAPMDINSPDVKVKDLATLPGVGPIYAKRIFDGRPYNSKDQLVSRGIIPQATYNKIKDLIIAKHSK